MELVAGAAHQRVRPNDVEQTLAQEFDVTVTEVNESIKELVAKDDLVYSYRDPCSYVEIPCNGCDGAHHAARPMHVVTDADGNSWLCDDDVDSSGDLSKQCWDCGEMAFTRAS